MNIKHFLITLSLASLAFYNTAVSQTTFPVGTKNKFYCVADNAQSKLYLVSPLKQISLSYRLTVWNRNLRYLQTYFPERQARITEIKRMIRHTKNCQNQGGSSNACSIFTNTNLMNRNTARIIDGRRCSGNNSPVVMLAMYVGNESLGSCTGTVVHPRIIITAAHCVKDEGGLVDEIEIYDLNGEFLTTASTVYAHDSYYGEADHDLSVIRTDEDLNTGIMEVLSSNDMQSGETVAISGYGEDERGRDGVFKAGFTTIRRQPGNTIEARFLRGEGYANTCYGDSGGPLVVQRGSSWVLAGTTANGDNDTCGVNGRSDLSRWCNISSPENHAFLAHRAPEVFD